MVDARGMTYMPSPPPQSGGETELRQWCVREFGRISTAVLNGRSVYLSLDAVEKKPEKPFAGAVAYFAAGVVGVGSAEGLHEYRSDAAWHKL
jgi:hypothetical protein